VWGASAIAAADDVVDVVVATSFCPPQSQHLIRLWRQMMKHFSMRGMMIISKQLGIISISISTSQA
jgi:hypothetical protein